MSYILDALKRADSERERGQVPGLHARPLPAAAAQATRRGPNLVLALVAVAALCACALLGWRLMRAGTAAPPGLPAQAAGVPAPPAQRPAQVQVQAAQAPAPTAAQAPVQAPAPPPTVSPAAAAALAPAPDRPPAPATPPMRATPAAPVAPAAPVMPVAQGAPLQQPPPAPAPMAATPPAASPAAPAPRTLTLAELPPEIRSQLPALAISGATYSANPAHRMLIINGQVFHEGEKPTPELTLEQIQPKSVVLGFRGYRYTVPY